MAASLRREGILQHRGNFGFLLSEEPGGRDVFVRGPSLRIAMDGDRVEVRLRRSGGRPEGEIVRVLERARKTVVGVLRNVGGKWWVESSHQEGAPWSEVESSPSVRLQAGRLASARITRWPTRSSGAACVVTELLGRPGDPGVRTRAILRSLEIPEKFPASVLREARKYPGRVTPEMWKGRLDLRKLPLFTIDGADAKDFDDAVSLEKLGGGRYRLGVHIADVSHYVRPGMELDIEAARRGTSVYLPGQVIPMLPSNLSNNLCSLMPGVERLAFSALMELDAGGNVVRSHFEKSLIKSWRRFTYEEVESLLCGKPVRDVSRTVLESVRAMGSLAKRLTEKRIRRGALDFDLPEYSIEVLPSGAPTAIIQRQRLDSHRLIEEFMILANETVAAFLISRGTSFPSRVHDDPDPEKLATLQEDVRKLGLGVGGNLASMGSRGLQGILKRIADHPLRDVLGVMVMRSLKQAVYSARPSGHFGLASKAYCHFTSPIRRYPDLVTHRVLEETIAEKIDTKKRKGRGRGRKSKSRVVRGGMEKICAHSSVRERIAVNAERKVLSVLRAELLSKKVGQEYTGVVMRSASMGVFVELLGTGTHGLVRGAKTRVGTKVRVRLQRVNEDKGEIELSLLGASKAPRTESPPSRKKRLKK